MKVEQLISPERITSGSHAASKKRALEELSTLMAENTPDLTKEEIFESLIGRERLGSTGLGHGVAIPHGRVKGRDQAVGAFLQLAEAIDFDAVDGKPVDLLFALLVPDHFTDEHLEVLSQLAEMFANEQLCERLRKSGSREQVFDTITHWQSGQQTQSA
ncbi:MAG: PTS IIA-like nitrogen regulatory protein PtsN [Gammaproteobacteria bacterium]